MASCVSMSREAHVNNLRSLATASYDANHIRAASFFSEQLVTLSIAAYRGYESDSSIDRSVVTIAAEQSRNDILFLSRCHYRAGQYQRAIHLLKSNPFASSNNVDLENSLIKSSDLRFRLIAAQCALAMEDWAEVLDIVEETAPEVEIAEAETSGSFIMRSSSGNTNGSAKRRTRGNASKYSMGSNADEGCSVQCSVNKAASIALVRASAFHELDRKQLAVQWYLTALERDPLCVEAFEQLVVYNLLSNDMELHLQNLLDTSGIAESDFSWLADYYDSRLGRWQRRPEDDIVSTIDSNFASNDTSGINSTSPILSPTDDLTKLRSLLNKHSHDFQLAKAERLFNRNDLKRCLNLTQSLLTADPYLLSCMPLHLSTLVEMGLKTDLFYVAHKLVNEYSDHAVSWYAVGCYYYAIGKYDQARRYFNKATTVDSEFAHAWLAFGHSFAMTDESDQSMAAYRTCLRMFKGCHVAPLCIGMEYLRTNNPDMASQFFKTALEICPDDPLVHNELGVLALRCNQYQLAVSRFTSALDLCGKYDTVSEKYEPIWFNLGHSYRHLSDYTAATKCYEICLRLKPQSNSSALTALGLTKHMQRDFHVAIELYHKALGIDHEDTVAQQALTRALQDALTPMARMAIFPIDTPGK